MEQKELKKKITEIINKHKVGTLATVSNNKPFTRYMTFFNKDLTLYTATSSDTHKIDDIEENSNVHILLGYEGEGFGDTFVEVEGKASIEDGSEIKNKLWSTLFKVVFSGPNDPKYVVLKIVPTQIRLMNKKGHPPETLEL